MKKILPLVMALVMMLSLASPVFAYEYPGVKGDTPVAAKKGQSPVLKDGEVWDTLGIVYSGNSSANHGTKISANKSYNEIRAEDGTLVGYFTFDKKGNDAKPNTDNLVITMVSDEYEVVVRWDCSKYYAYAKLDGEGKYSLPQLMQDNGKIQSFDQIWIVSITKKYTPPQFEGEVSIAKHVDGTLIVDTNYGKYFSKEYMSFDLYKVTSKGDMNFGSPVKSGDFNDFFGTIDFGIVYESGWYAVVETLTVEGAEIFNEAEPVYIYVGEDGFKSEDVVIMSADDKYGMVAVNEMVPSVNGQIVDYWSAYVNDFGKLDGAVWVWNVTNPSETYGVSGNAISFDIDFELADVPDEVIFYLACDNAASLYVNDELAYYTASFKPGNNNYKFEEGFDSTQFDGRQEFWSQLSEWDITNYLEQGPNKITIYAANSAQDGGDNAGYNESNNPAGLIFKCVIPGTVFNNTTAEFKSEAHVVPMVSSGYVDASGDWGEELWDSVLNIATNFVAPDGYDAEFGFTSGLLAQNAEYIWDKTKDEVTFESEEVWTQFGSNCAYFKFEYTLEDGADLSSVLFTDFNIAADNEFALLVNGKLVKISDAFKKILSIGETVTDIGDYFDAAFLHNYYNDFIKLNAPSNEYLDEYDWHMIYTVTAADMLSAFLSSDNTDSVVIEIYAYNVPEQSLPRIDDFDGNPAMVIFAGSFRYETITR